MRYIQPLERRLHLNGGTIDTTFGDSGTATGDIATVLPPHFAINNRWFTQDSGGRIYALVLSPDNDANGPYKFVVTRFTRDGRLDTRFHGSGYKVLDGYGYDGPTSASVHIFVDPNNRTYVIDGSVIWRLTPGGRADQTFGRRGKIIPPFTVDENNNRAPMALAWDADGRTYVAGSATGKKGTRMAVIRLTESGAWDTTWGYQGIYKSPVPSSEISFNSVATAQMLRFLADGKLAVVGTYRRDDAGPGPGIPVIYTNATWATRLNPDGNVDISYGTDGYVEYAKTDEPPYRSGQPSTWYWVQPQAISADGAITGVLTINPASEDSSGGSNFRIGPDGRSINTDLQIAPASFAHDHGIKKIDGPIAIQGDGDIIARRGSEPVLFRSNLDGTIDTTFGNSGFATLPEDVLDDVQIQPDGSILTMNKGALQQFNLHRLFRDDAPLAQFDGPFIKTPRSTAVRVAVTYRDDDGINQGTIGAGDIKISGPFDGTALTRTASLESISSLDGGRFLAIYKITSPGGWSAINNGRYTVRLGSGQVQDINGAAAPAQTLGTFRVRIR